MSTEIETVTPAPLPDLVRPAAAAANTLDVNDITLPRLYKGESSSSAFKDEDIDVKLGDIYIGQGAEDPDPIVIARFPKGADKSESVRAHVLGVTKGLSLSRQGEPLRTWKWGDKDAHPDARPTFDYVVVLPEVDQRIPVKVLLSSTSTQTAKRMNFVLLDLEDVNLWPTIGWDVCLKRRESTEGGKKHSWYVWQFRQAQPEDVKPEHVEIARRIAAKISGVSGDTTPPVDTRPGI